MLETKVVHVHSGSQEVRACAAIVLYGARLTDLHFAMLHGIHGAHGKEQLGAGQPLSMEGLSDALTSLAEAQAGYQQTDFLPDNVLSASPVHLAWWRKPSPRTVFFRSGSESETFNAPHPGLIFVAKGRELFIGALTGSERPTAETPVCQAPYFNVWAGGKMCVGNVALPGDTITSRIAAWEDAFFNSWFTHPNGIKLVNHPGEMRGLWTELSQKRDEPIDFPVEALVPMGLTAGQFVAKGVRA